MTTTVKTRRGFFENAYTVTVDLPKGREESRTFIATSYSDAMDRMCLLYPAALGGRVESNNGYTDFTR